MTVRRAIEKVAELGLVTAVPGKGTFVNQPPLEAATFRLSEFEEDMRARGLVPSSRLLQAQAVPADEETAAKLKVKPGRRVLRLKRLLYADGEPMVYDLKYLRYDPGQPILEAELEYMNLPSIMSHHSKALPAESRFVVKVGSAGVEEARLLDIAPGAPVFIVEQTIYTAQGSVVGWGVLVYRGDRYYFTSLPRLL
jgi:GntR family transcriptional regulator